MIYYKNASAFPSVNRYEQVFEYMFIFTKNKPKTINILKDKKNRWAGTSNLGVCSQRQKNGKLKKGKRNLVAYYGMRHNIWKYSTGYGYSTKDKIAFKHPAIFPERLAKDHILSWSDKNDIVLDPMCGSGTTCKQAEKLNRRWIGIDLSEEYCEIAKQRIQIEARKYKFF